MFSYKNPGEDDLFQKYKLLTYRLAFPLGIVLNVFYMIVVAKGQGFLYFLSIFQTIFLILLTVLVWGRTKLGFIESAFYFTFQTAFLLMTYSVLHDAILKNSITPAILADAVNSLALWSAIFMLAVFLTLKPDMSVFFIAYAFLGLVLLGVITLIPLWSLHQLTSEYLFRWVNPLAGLMIVILLLQRMGTLQQRQASVDALTGALNRHTLVPTLEHEISRALRYERPLTLILLDIDHFKDINDTFGHLVGDHVLIVVASLLRDSIRSTDYLGRWGGEEFLIILPETEALVAEKLAERLCDSIRQKQYGEVEQVTASFGVTTYKTGQTLEDVQQAVDMAMYQAKKGGRDQVVSFPST